jgi:hypothetical protein
MLVIRLNYSGILREGPGSGTNSSFPWWLVKDLKAELDIRNDLAHPMRKECSRL